MIIREIHIEGFGIFRDRMFRFSPGLNIFYGPNEAGKSTLLAFIHQVLFGFPDGRSKDRAYEAIRGGRLGGRLVFEDRGGERYTVERFAGARGGDLSIRLPDGSTGTENTLGDLLGHTSKDVFCKIFAFGLDQLQVFSSLQDEGVRSHIYSAGTGGISISEIEGQLAKKADALFRPRASNPTINKLIKKIDQQSQDLKALSQQSQDYDRLIAHKDTLGEMIEAEAQGLRAVGDQMNQLLRYKDAWEPWRQLVDADGALKSLPVIDTFPEDGRNKLTRIEENLENVQKDIQKTEDEIGKLKDKAGQFAVDQGILLLESRIESLKSDLSRYTGQQQERHNLKRDLKKNDEDWRDSLTQLGPGWTEERVGSFDGSIQTQEEVRNFKQVLDKAEGDHLDWQRQVKAFELLVEDAEGDAGKLKEQDTEQPVLSEQAYKDKRSAFQKVSHLHARYSVLSESDARPSAGLELPLWPMIVLVFLGILVGLGVWSSGSARWGVGAAGSFLLLSICYWLLRRQISQGFSGQPAENPIQSLKTNEQQLKAAAQELGIDGIPTEEELIAKQLDLEKIGELIGERKTRQNRLEEIEGDLANKKRALDRLKEGHLDAEKTLRTRQEEWETFLARLGLSKTLSPDSSLLLINGIKTACDRLKNVTLERARLAALHEAVTHFETEAREVLTACHLVETEGQSTVSLVDYLTRLLDENRNGKREYDTLLENLKDCETQLKHLRNQHLEQKNAWSHLLQSVDAESAETFREKHDLYLKRQALQDRQRQYRQESERLLGIGEKYAKALLFLEKTSLAELEHEVEMLKAQQEVLSGELDTKREALGAVRKSIEDMESQELASELRLLHRADGEKLNALAAEWAAWTVAKTLLTQARDFYEKERRPGVIKEAESIFAQMTNGSYTRVFAPLDGREIQVADQSGGIKGVDSLSRGTAEQLYLALRMGLIREFGRNAQVLPVIMDDITVNFDPERATQAVSALNMLSQDHQIIVFTCHPTTMALFQSLETEEEVNVVVLDR